MSGADDSVLTSFKLNRKTGAAVENHLTGLTYALGFKVHKVVLFQWLADRFLGSPELQEEFRKFLDERQKSNAER